MGNTKICTKCGRELPLECFSKDKTKKDGLYCWCKECGKQYSKQYFAKHKAEKCVYQNQYYTTIKGYAYKVRQNNLQSDREHGRCGMDEDPLAPHSYYIEKFSEGIDYYDGKNYPFNELGFDRIDDNLPHTIDNMVVATTFHNKDRWNKRMTVEEYKEYIHNNFHEINEMGLHS